VHDTWQLPVPAAVPVVEEEDAGEVEEAPPCSQNDAGQDYGELMMTQRPMNQLKRARSATPSV
jgi:hypothetical protein